MCDPLCDYCDRLACYWATARSLRPTTLPTTPASAVSSPRLPVRTPVPAHESTVSVSESGSVCGVSVFLPRQKGEPLPNFSGALSNTSTPMAHSTACTIAAASSPHLSEAASADTAVAVLSPHSSTAIYDGTADAALSLSPLVATSVTGLLLCPRR